MTKTAAILLCFWFATLAGRSQTWPANGSAANGSVAVSRSGQFTIYGVDAAARRPAAPELATNSALVRLEPALLTVSCERIKQALLTTMNAPDQWRGKISVVLHPFQTADEDIVITSERFSEVWRYRMDLPDAVEPQRLVRAVTQLLLLEIVNRNAGEQLAPLPSWLAEGMPELLLAGSDIDLVLQPAPPASGNNPTSRQEMRVVRRTDLLKQSRERLGAHAPLTLTQLGQPPENLTGESGEVFRASAVLLLHELLLLPNGGTDLFATLPELAWDPDWRVGLLRGFHRHFKREVDLEKWWALQTVYVATRTPEKMWSRAESLEKLNDLLLCPLEVQVGTNEPALQTAVPLQAIIRGWELPRQNRMLREKINLLGSARLRTAKELSGLVDDYRRVLEVYLRNMGGGVSEKQFLQGRHPAGQPMVPGGAPSANNAFVKDALAQLDVLDQRREAWRATPENGH